MRFNTPIAKTLWEARGWLTDHPTAHEDSFGCVRWTCNAISLVEDREGPARAWYENWLRGQTEISDNIPDEWGGAEDIQDWRFDLFTLAALVAKEERV